MQHIANLAEENSYSQKDRNKFNHWYQKWTSGPFPIVCSLAIEVLGPAKLLSKTFQSEDDSMEAQAHVSQTKQNLARIRGKVWEVANSKMLP